MPRIAATLALLAALMLGAPLLGGCAQSGGGAQPATGQPGTGGGDPGDPFEASNRRLLDLNIDLDEAVIRPAALGYRYLFHPWVRTRLRNVVDNMQEPRFASNNLLQGKPLAAGHNLMRFVINSTLGVAGMFDLAPYGGPDRRPNDFGRTLHLWGVPDGPYIMWPVLGPSTARDSVGFVVNGFMNPIDWLLPFYATIARGALDGLDQREQNIENLDALRADSLDFYARLRSVWRQRRDAELGRAGTEAEADPLDDPEPPRR